MRDKHNAKYTAAKEEQQLRDKHNAKFADRDIIGELDVIPANEGAITAKLFDNEQASSVIAKENRMVEDIMQERETKRSDKFKTNRDIKYEERQKEKMLITERNKIAYKNTVKLLQNQDEDDIIPSIYKYIDIIPSIDPEVFKKYNQNFNDDTNLLIVQGVFNQIQAIKTGNVKLFNMYRDTVERYRQRSDTNSGKFDYNMHELLNMYLNTNNSSYTKKFVHHVMKLYLDNVNTDHTHKYQRNHDFLDTVKLAAYNFHRYSEIDNKDGMRESEQAVTDFIENDMIPKNNYLHNRFKDVSQSTDRGYQNLVSNIQEQYIQRNKPTQLLQSIVYFAEENNLEFDLNMFKPLLHNTKPYESNVVPILEGLLKLTMSKSTASSESEISEIEGNQNTLLDRLKFHSKTKDDYKRMDLHTRIMRATHDHDMIRVNALKKQLKTHIESNVVKDEIDFVQERYDEGFRRAYQNENSNMINFYKNALKKHLESKTLNKHIGNPIQNMVEDEVNQIEMKVELLSKDPQNKEELQKLDTMLDQLGEIKKSDYEYLYEKYNMPEIKTNYDIAVDLFKKATWVYSFIHPVATLTEIAIESSGAEDFINDNIIIPYITDNPVVSGILKSLSITFIRGSIINFITPDMSINLNLKNQLDGSGPGFRSTGDGMFDLIYNNQMKYQTFGLEGTDEFLNHLHHSNLNMWDYVDDVLMTPEVGVWSKNRLSRHGLTMNGGNSVEALLKSLQDKVPYSVIQDVKSRLRGGIMRIQTSDDLQQKSDAIFNIIGITRQLEVRRKTWTPQNDMDVTLMLDLADDIFMSSVSKGTSQALSKVDPRMPTRAT